MRRSPTCEPCRTAELCVADVVPSIAAVLEADPCRESRTKAIATLLRLAARDGRAREAIRRAARHNSDPFVRRTVADARYGHFVLPRKRYERHQRRHGRRRRG